MNYIFFYDKNGYSIRRLIHLKWFFLFELDSIDKKPENRIHMQYSELRKGKNDVAEEH